MFYVALHAKLKNKTVKQLKMQSLMSDLAKWSFVTCPDNAVCSIYEQYTRDLSGFLDKHAPMVTQTFIYVAAGWLSDSYLLAKAVSHQFQCIWYKDKTAQNKLHSVNRLPGAFD